MPYTKRIVCLANSRKLQGRCIAGKEITAEGFGKWIRPISSQENGELWHTHMRCQDGQAPNLLDVISISFKGRKPHGYQIENHLIDEAKRWQRVEKIALSDLPALCDPVDTLWVNGFHSQNGINDRVPLDIAERELRSSLLLIRPSRLTVSVAQEYNSRKARAYFFFNSTAYRLAVTDPAAESLFLAQEDGEYPISRRNVYLCASLGEPYRGFTYKLVAAIINLT